MTREYSCRKCCMGNSPLYFRWFSWGTFDLWHFDSRILIKVPTSTSDSNFYVLLHFICWFHRCSTFVHSAELRTINFCDNDLFRSQSYIANSRVGENQQSTSARSLYDNVDEEEFKKVVGVNKFLMPPSAVQKSTSVNRSKSLQYTGPRKPTCVLIRRNLRKSSSIEDRVEIISNRSSTPVESEQGVIVTSFESNSNYPFYVKILRQMQKISRRWRTCSARESRGRDQVSSLWLTIVMLCLLSAQSHSPLIACFVLTT